MGAYRIIIGIAVFTLAIATLVISLLQFREKGFLFNNVYIWASQEQRAQMDAHPEYKRPHYRQSGFIFLFLGIFCLLDAAYFVTGRYWLYLAGMTAMVLALAYSVVSSIRMERKKK